MVMMMISKIPCLVTMIQHLEDLCHTTTFLCLLPHRYTVDTEKAQPRRVFGETEKTAALRENATDRV